MRWILSLALSLAFAVGAFADPPKVDPPVLNLDEGGEIASFAVQVAPGKQLGQSTWDKSKLTIFQTADGGWMIQARKGSRGAYALQFWTVGDTLPASGVPPISTLSVRVGFRDPSPAISTGPHRIEPIPAKNGKVYPKGRVAPKNLAFLKAQSEFRHRHKLRSLPNITAATWDCRKLGIAPKVIDQGQCGSCWDFSGCEVATGAYLKAGYGKADSFWFSPQYVLDCGQNGGCDGDDNTTVLAMAKDVGLALDSDYGPYQAQPGNCKNLPAGKLLKIKDWGFADGGQGNGVTSLQAIKNAMAAYGPIGCAIAADDAFMNTPAGQVFQGSGSQDIDHDVLLIGWDDSKGAWLLQNSWGTDWCDGGYCWIAYGANLVGTEAVWAVVDPITPQPTPNPPPGPGPAPTPTPPAPIPGSVSVTLTADQVASVLQQSGAKQIRPEMTLAELLAVVQPSPAPAPQPEPPPAPRPPAPPEPPQPISGRWVTIQTCRGGRCYTEQVWVVSP